ncbi:hypothetical protein FQR65_LT06962 [Abscondita terminalis]|nr:hypothetical protein FQR65_LT06962 [Abscondita terminalis]
MSSVHNWKLVFTLIIPYVIGNEVFNSETSPNPNMYLTMLQMMQKTLLDMYKDAATPTEPPAVKMDLTNYNEIINRLKLASTSNALNSIPDNSNSNILKFLNSLSQSNLNLPASLPQSLVPTVMSNGVVGMTPLGGSTVQYGTSPNTFSATYSTLPNYQMNNAPNAIPLLYNGLKNPNILPQSYGGVGFGLSPNNYGIFGNRHIQPDSYQSFENGYGSGGYNMYENGFGGGSMLPLPNYFPPSLESPRYGEPFWRSDYQKHNQFSHLSPQFEGRYARSTGKNIPLNAKKNKKIMKKPVSRYAPSYQTSKHIVEKPKLKIIRIKS